MSPERSLSIVQNAFDQGSLADGVILAVARAQNNRAMTPSDHALLVRAVAFLNAVKNGYTQLDSASVSREAAAWARSLEAAVQSNLSFCDHSFAEGVDSLLSALERLLDNRPVESSDLNNVRRFFNELFRTSLGNIERTFAEEPVSGELKCLPMTH